jgi:benzylsuccinate CoA-transferase BbsE subunit
MSQQAEIELAEARGPLAGVRVLDLVDGDGAYGPKLLVGLGADVVRVEPPDGSQARRRCWTLPGPAFGRTAPAEGGPYFVHYDGGKRGVTLDPGTEVGRALLERLMRSVDVVLDNGQLARYGCEPERLTAESPLVVVSSTPFGREGPRAGWRGGDLVVQMMSGMTGLFGFYDERPARFGPEQASEMAGLAGALGALIALFGARRQGRGELVEIAVEQVCALVSLQMWNASLYHQFGFTRVRRTRSEAAATTLYQAADGFVALGAFRRPAELMQLLREAGEADGLPAELERQSETELGQSGALEAAVRRFVAGQTREMLIERVQAHGLIGLAVYDLGDVLADPFLDRRAFFVDVEYPALGLTGRDAGPPIRLGAAALRYGRRPPSLGEHNAEVYATIGVGAEELASLRRNGAV